MLVNPITGEVVQNLASLDDMELAELVGALEQTYKELRSQFYAVRNLMIARMQEQEATLHLTDAYKLRLRKSTRIKENKEARELIARLFEEVPSEFKDGFKTEITTSVSTLKEVAKLGSRWSDKVSTIIDEAPYLVIEPREEEAEVSVS